MIDLDAICALAEEHRLDSCVCGSDCHGKYLQTADALHSLLGEIDRLKGDADRAIRFPEWKADYESLHGPISEREQKIAAFAWTGGALTQYALRTEVAKKDAVIADLQSRLDKILAGIERIARGEG